MGIEHLKQLQEFLEKKKPKAFTKSYLSRELKIDYNTVLEIIDYLITNNKIKKIMIRKSIEGYRAR